MSRAIDDLRHLPPTRQTAGRRNAERVLHPEAPGRPSGLDILDSQGLQEAFLMTTATVRETLANNLRGSFNRPRPKKRTPRRNPNVPKDMGDDVVGRRGGSDIDELTGRPGQIRAIHHRIVKPARHSVSTRRYDRRRVKRLSQHLPKRPEGLQEIRLGRRRVEVAEDGDGNIA
ncbi:MAG: hypothetical protein GY772_29010, partial [bacterium]|nr:hypothetical protein [bacterium]